MMIREKLKDFTAFNILQLACELLIVLVVVVLFTRLLGQTKHYDTVPIREGWEIEVSSREAGSEEFHNTIYREQSLDTFKLERAIHRGEVVTMRNIIPENAPEQATLMFQSFQSVVEVYLNGEQVYSYGKDLFEKKKMVGGALQHIRLMDQNAGDELEIRLTAGDDHAFYSVSQVDLVDAARDMAMLLRKNIFIFVVAVFLFVLGVELPVLGIVFHFFRQEYERLLLIGMLAISMGGWSLCNSRLIQFFSSDFAWNTMIEYILLYTAPIPVMRLVDASFDGKNRKAWRKYLVYGITLALVVFLIASIVLHIFNVVHICRTLHVYHYICIFGIIGGLIGTYRPFREMGNSEKTLYFGIIVMIAVSAIDLVRFAMMATFGTSYAFVRFSALPVGTLIFIILLIMGYLFYVYDAFLMQNEREHLQKKAYQDVLTGLYNRAYCEMEFEKLLSCDKYSIISIDVNGLKRINDNLGHAAGDLLIKSFGEILKEAFSDYGTCVRMGGDEFVVIVRGGNKRELARRVIRMVRLEQDKSETLDFNIRAAYGEASNEEVRGNPIDPEKVYKLADQRMYEMKRENHKKDVLKSDAVGVVPVVEV